MAKWGEGDPRWIVEERADATNVNNWHWTEKNATSWSQDRLKYLLEGLVIENEIYSCEITELTKCDGEASANNRKAKLIFFYEWDIKADWKGKFKESKTSFNGKLELPNLSEENSPEDLDIIVSVSNNNDDEAYQIKEFMRIEGSKVIQEQCGKYVTDLKEEYSKGIILPNNKTSKGKLQEPHKSSQNVMKNEINKPVISSQRNVGVQIHCRKITDKLKFMCEPSDLYRALTEPDRVQAFTRNIAEIVPEKGGNFSLFDGSIHGTFTELNINKMIVMRWRQRTWPAEHYSTVTLEFSPATEGTELKLTQTGIPESEYERTQQGWNRYYWEAIKQTFGFGATLF